MSSRAASRIAVIFGGLSSEREVSLATGKGVCEALRGEGYEVIELDAGTDLSARLLEAAPDVVFNALHGRWGEDGAVQGILEWLRIPYTHSGVLASALAIDKRRAKDAFVAAGLPVAVDRLVSRTEAASGHALPPPYVLKPYNEGSSIGIVIVPEGAERPPRLPDTMPEILMAEAYVPGRELTVSVLGERPLGITEIVTDGWYDYEAKYSAGGSRHILPADVPRPIAEACTAMALTAHAALGCRGLSRSDFRWDDREGVSGIRILETNTQPGMTPTSLSPEQAAAAGMSFGALCRWLVEDASCER